MKFELNEKQVRVVFKFAKMFNFGDLHNMIKDRMTEEEIYEFDYIKE